MLQVKVETKQVDLKAIIWVWVLLSSSLKCIAGKCNYSTFRIFFLPLRDEEKDWMHMALIPKSKVKKDKGKFGAIKLARNRWKGGIPSSISKLTEQTEASTTPCLVFTDVQSPGQDFWEYCQSRFNRRDKIKYSPLKRWERTNKKPPWDSQINSSKTSGPGCSVPFPPTRKWPGKWPARQELPGSRKLPGTPEF